MAPKLKVIFAGGSAYSDITPQVGARISLWPYGLRILDHLGCYETIGSLIEKPAEHGILVGPDGKPMKTRYNLIRPGVTLGYTLPTACLLLPYTDPTTAQNMIALWQFAPVLACALT
ncbi:hypothetical protein B0J12DRAFT_742388 [Macrophomina phaseolina]|uniref:Uncharacterized protein n=1 Tax=Macrophomina phaseolina TaxID=35725 RepID=A0ABQ8G4K3_9PEZI|nr:hypothetical protein B0J12DRAFT_742388 [Macrophomina phaseolina]